MTTKRVFDHAIALTGGIATGKSTVSSILADMGYEIIDADMIAHEILDEHRDIIAEVFGEGIISGDKVDRKALGAIVFADKDQRRRLEDIVHPPIYHRIVQTAHRLDQKEKPYIVDIPLFFERETYPISKVIVVYAPKELQISRLMERNKLSKREAIQRIDAQMDIENKKDKATYLIENTGTIDELERKCQEVHDKIAADFGYNVAKNR